VSGPLLDRWGRRAALLSLNVPGLAGWMLIATAQVQNGFLWQVYAGRLLTGVSTGMASVPATVMAQASRRPNSNLCSEIDCRDWGSWLLSPVGARKYRHYSFLADPFKFIIH
jgi:MFS family permease